MALDSQANQDTIQCLVAANLSTFNGLSVLLVRLAKKGMIDVDDVQALERASRVPLDHPDCATSEVISELYRQHDQLFAWLRDILGGSGQS
ncbi:hypothetical protein [Novosphingobium sp. 9]|uniref:hypothetical protein n=1 Tax=Novosphingobium sp. 9 TaxID=2025349 RepID=UPI0021B619BA|nr:hypothetical protein [Novosphingobium sp. 9]